MVQKWFLLRIRNAGPIFSGCFKGTSSHAGKGWTPVDVSHMGQVILRAKSYEQVAGEFEKLILHGCGGAEEGRQRYGFYE